MPDFLKSFLFVHQYVRVSVCPSLKALITSGMIWCDINWLCVIG